MANITMNISKSTVSASAHIPYGAYKRAVELATAYEGTIGRTTDNRFTVTFGKAKTAKTFKSEWEADYAKAHAAYTPKPTEPKAPTKGRNFSPITDAPFSHAAKRARKAKALGFDFDSVKGKTKSEKNKALHAMLVGMGITDSRTPEYTAVWSNRPWAK